MERKGVINQLLDELVKDSRFDIPLELAQQHLTLPSQTSVAGSFQEYLSIIPYSGFCFEMLTKATFESSHHNGGNFLYIQIINHFNQIFLIMMKILFMKQNLVMLKCNQNLYDNK